MQSDPQYRPVVEFLLDLVCDTFGLAPVALADDDEDPADVLYDLVHRLARAA